MIHPLPYLIVFFSALVAVLLLTPLVREINRALGMVDKPDPRRINKVAIPRGGGVALALGILITYAVFHFATGRQWLVGLADSQAYRLAVLAVSIMLVGLADDRFSLRPRVKLAFQIIIAALVWYWADLGFGDLWAWMPAWLDCVVTVLWIVGAVNAFNLIDGLDGLASGLALIAIVGMAGGLIFVGNIQATLFYFAMAGGILGFLRYNYNPASVFLGDSGSMFLGFVIGTLPLASHQPNSFLVSVGVPLLAMGVPIFDTALAILRRSLRRLIRRGGTEGEVMSADVDHIHHRILRAVGLNQRKAAWALYLAAAGCVVTGWVALFLKSRSAGLWLVALAVAAVVIFKDSKIELFDAGLLLNEVAHPETTAGRRRLASWSVPFYVIFDIIALVLTCVVCDLAFNNDLTPRTIRTYLIIRVFSTFVFLVGMNTYRTIWSRALGSNYVRLVVACVFGAILGSAIIYYLPLSNEGIAGMTLAYTFVSAVALVSIRLFRGLVRDLFYAIDCARLGGRKGVSRILVYGAGLRYRAFRRELVRTTSANDRMIVGLVDDNVILRNRYIGGLRVYGTINEAPDIISRLNVDAVVIACDVDERWLAVVKDLLAPTGVKLTVFSFSESEVPLG